MNTATAHRAAKALEAFEDWRRSGSEFRVLRVLEVCKQGMVLSLAEWARGSRQGEGRQKLLERSPQAPGSAK